MLCEKCKERNATVYIKNIVNDQQTEMHLCAQCAAEMGVTQGLNNPFLNLSEEFDSMLNTFPFGGFFGAPEKKIFDKAESCPLCGASLTDIRRTGRAGCPNCYSLFGHILDPIIRKIHGDTSHNGRIPASAGAELSSKRQLEELKSQLKTAISNEDFENAARLRDEIRTLENNQ